MSAEHSASDRNSPDATAAESAQPTASLAAPVTGGTRYRTVRFHAAGGLGAVYLAEDGELHRAVALKCLQAHADADPIARRRFVREAEITGRLEHPGIVPVYGLLQSTDGRPFYTMHFVEGATLHSAIRRLHENFRNQRVAFQKLLRQFVQVCDTIAYAHSRGVLHRDLKPQNIMLGPFGEVLVVDWGLAKSPEGSGSGIGLGDRVSGLGFRKRRRGRYRKLHHRTKRNRLTFRRHPTPDPDPRYPTPDTRYPSPANPKPTIARLKPARSSARRPT